MANTTIQLKRSSVAGKQPNTTQLSIGELAINLTDKKIYSSDGTYVFEPAGNVTNLNVTAGIKANGSYGVTGQVLATNGSSVYWTADQTANVIAANSLTASYITITTGTLSVGNSTVNTDIGNNYISVGNSSSFVNVYSSYISIGNISTTDSLQTNSSSIILGNVTQGATETNTVFISSKLLQDKNYSGQTGLGSAIALGHPGWNGPGGKVHYAPQGTIYATDANLFFVNTSFMQMGNSTAYFNMTPRSLTIGNTIVNSSLISTTALRANGSLGTAGQVLATNGTAIYWTADQGANAITANSLTANLITITTGTLSVGNSTVNTDIGNNYISVGNTSGYVNVYSNRIYLGNSSANATINSTIYTGTSNNANYLGTVAAAAYIQNTDSRTLSGNLVFSAANVAFTGNVRLNGVIANGSLGTAGQVLSSNGSAVYWAPASSGSSVNTTPSNIKNIVNTSVGITQSVIDTASATGISTIEYLISARDNTNLNYKSSRVLITTDGTSSFVTEYGIVLSNNSAQVCSFDSDINTGSIRLLATGDSADVDVSLQRVVLGSSTEAGDIAAAPVLDSVTNTSNIIAASANSVKTAYDVGIAGQTSAAAAYTNAVSYTDTKAATAYSNATSYADTKAAAAYSNATSYTDSRIIDSVTNTSITYAASANSVKNAYDRAIDANTRASSAQTSATDAYSNAIMFASNASNINTGTLAEARLPYRMNQNVQTTDTVEFAGLTLSGNLVVSGNVNIIGANNLSISDNMIYLNSNNDVSNPDLGFAGNYNDGTYHHAGFFRDASDGIWKVFDNYGPEPDASAFIDTTNTTFHIADFQTNTLFASSLSANGSLGTAGQVLTSNGTTLYWSTVSGGAGGFTNGQSISVNNFVITGAFSANSSNGTSGQVLTSNGTGTYWSTVSGGSGISSGKAIAMALVFGG
jgi:hypothetical protein